MQEKNAMVLPKPFLSLFYSGLFVFVIFCQSCIRKGPEPIEGLIPFSNTQRELADKIISCFENDDPILHYEYAEALDDGRGITAGRAGFTSATGDMLVVIQLYTEVVPNNILASYIPLLEQYAANENPSLSGLENMINDWALAANDSIFRNVQDIVVDSFYYLPAVGYAKEIGAKYPLTLLNLYDAIIQHGDGDDPDGITALIVRTTDKCGGTPSDGIDEYRWLETFNDVRIQDLCDPDNEDTREEWRDSKGRAIALDKLRKQSNFLLDKAVCINPYGTEFCL